MSQTSRYSAVHADPDGPGDARPTGLDIVEDEGREQILADHVMLITGCSPGGLGVEVARALHLTGEISSVALTLMRTLRKLVSHCSEPANVPWITVACSRLAHSAVHAAPKSANKRVVAHAVAQALMCSSPSEICRKGKLHSKTP